MRRRLILLFALVPTLLLAAFNESGRLRDLTVTGDLRVGGSLDLTDITASGTVTADSVYSEDIEVNSTLVFSKTLRPDYGYFDTYAIDANTSYPRLMHTGGVTRLYLHNVYNHIRASNYEFYLRSGFPDALIGIEQTYSNNFIGVGRYGIVITNDGATTPSSGDSLLTVNGGAYFTCGIQADCGINVGQTVTIGGLVTKDTVVTLADDAEWVGPTGVSGWGSCQIGDMQEWIEFDFNADASVINLRDGSTNIANTDSDGNLCIYDGGDGPVWKNRLGASLLLKVHIWH